MIKNQHGDVSITILVLGVFIVSALALLSFYLAGINGDETLKRIGILNKVNSLSDEVKFYRDSGIEKDPAELMDIFEKEIHDGSVAYFGIEGNGEYKISGIDSKNEIEFLGFKFGEKKKIFSVEYKFRR
ncbi:hypothetical protein HY449_01480 [Candidatus Pacearchaeota archaeon]|nr:hypothetical protein [Candidatus Pacearchaeota archaeon]